MFTDLVGYTSLAQKNESLALELLEQHRVALRGCLLRHNGKEIKTMGDGFLVEFGSALEAVNCGRAMQEALKRLNATLPPERKILVRIGIHVGDIVHSKGDIHGDAVNVASHIERLAGPGEICMTQQVYDHVRNKIDFRVEFLGKNTLKNVEFPVDVYKVPQVAERALPASSTSLTKHRIAVLPLANISPDPKDEYFADGMTEELISSISKVDDLKVISRTSAMKYKNSNKTVGEIARELNVGVALEGSVRKAGNKLRINVQLIDVQTDEHLWSQSYDRELQDIFAIQSEIAEKVAEALQVHLVANQRRKIEKKATESIDAYTFYLKGLHYRGEGTEEGFKKAIQYFEESLQKDQGFALAYAGLADCYARLAEDGIIRPNEGYPKAKEYAMKALELDNALAEAHATLGAILEDYYWDLSGAEEEFKRALELNPNYGKVCHSYGAHLACMGRLDEAVSEIERARELNPLALEVNDCAAVIFNCVNDYDRAIEACQLMLKVDENYFPAYQDLAEVYMQKSMFDEAIKTLQKALTISKASTVKGRHIAVAATVKGRLGYAYALAGRRADAQRLLHELQEASKTKYVTPVAMALINCGLGNKSRALQLLERAYRERAGGIHSLKVRPLWASLRSAPRFKRLLVDIGLEGKASVRSTTPALSSLK